MIAELEAVTGGENGRLMLFLPPGSAKSTYGSVLFPAWYFAQKPGRAVLGASHTATLAERFSKKVQGLVRDHGPTLGYRLTTEAADLWTTTNGGEYRAAGANVGIAGFRADLGVVDDLMRSREEAESLAARDKLWSWWLSDFLPRLKPEAAIVLINTRWHQDDLAGRLLATEGDRWRVLKVPAIAGENDPLGRAPGEPLWSDDGYGYGLELAQVRETYERAGAMRDWWSLYQQEPRPPAGTIFRVDQIPICGRRAARPPQHGPRLGPGRHARHRQQSGGLDSWRVDGTGSGRPGGDPGRRAAARHAR
jgi:hypothetical protein